MIDQAWPGCAGKICELPDDLVKWCQTMVGYNDPPSHGLDGRIQVANLYQSSHDQIVPQVVIGRYQAFLRAVRESDPSRQIWGFVEAELQQAKTEFALLQVSAFLGPRIENVKGAQVSTVMTEANFLFAYPGRNDEVVVTLRDMLPSGDDSDPAGGNAAAQYAESIKRDAQALAERVIGTIKVRRAAWEASGKKSDEPNTALDDEFDDAPDGDDDGATSLGTESAVRVIWLTRTSNIDVLTGDGASRATACRNLLGLPHIVENDVVVELRFTVAGSMHLFRPNVFSSGGYNMWCGVIPQGWDWGRTCDLSDAAGGGEEAVCPSTLLSTKVSVNVVGEVADNRKATQNDVLDRVLGCYPAPCLLPPFPAQPLPDEKVMSTLAV